MVTEVSFYGSSWAIVRRTVAGCLGCLRARKRNPVVGRDARKIRARRPLENVAPGVSYHGAAHRLAARATPIRIEKEWGASAVPEILALLRVRLTPEPNLSLHGCAFGGGVGSAVVGALLVLVLLVVPRHPSLDLIEARVLSVRQQDSTNKPSIGPLVLALESYILARKYLRKMLGGLRSEGLVVLRRVDAFQPDGVGKIALAENVDRIAVRDADDFCRKPTQPGQCDTRRRANFCRRSRGCVSAGGLRDRLRMLRCSGMQCPGADKEACGEVARGDRDHRPVCLWRTAPTQADIESAGNDQRDRHDDRFIHRQGSLAALVSRARRVLPPRLSFWG